MIGRLIMAKPRAPIRKADAPAGLRQRFRKRSASWRVWWEPRAEAKAAGFKPQELDAERISWSIQQAKLLNRDVDRALGRAMPGKSAKAKASYAAPKDTFRALVQAYTKSPDWDNLRPATQHDYRGAFNILNRKWGSYRVASFTKPVVYEYYETLYAMGKKHQAVALIRKMSLLFSYAEKKGWREGNPALRIGAKQPPPRERIASWPEIEALLDAAKPWPSMACAIALAVFMGQRQKDLREAKRKDFANDVWKFVRSKRGNQGALAVHPEVLPFLEKAMQGHEGADALLVSEVTNRPYSIDHFGKVWARVRESAAMEMPEVASLQFRDLRRTFGHYARMGGAGTRDVGDALGNNAYSDPRISGTYMPQNFQSASNAVLAVQRPKPEEKEK